MERGVAGLDVLDDLRADHGVEGPIREGQREDGRLHEAGPVALHVPQLVEGDVDADDIAKVPQDPARSAAHVQDTPEPRVPPSHDRVTAALPVALQRNDAVEGALVVVRRLDRVTEPPEVAEGADVRATEPEDARLRASGVARDVLEWHLDDPPASAVRAHEELRQDVEVRGARAKRPRRRCRIDAEAAGEI